MADRRLREQAIALPQRMAFSERRLRSLALRANPGAMRTAVGDSTEASPTDLTGPFPILSLTASSGRWALLGQVNVTVLGGTHPWIDASVGFTDASSGLEVTEGEFHVPTRRLYHVGTDTMSGTITIAGDFVTDQNVVVTMMLQEMRENDYSWWDARLQLTPC